MLIRPQNVLLMMLDERVASLNTTEVLMLHAKVKMIQEHVTQTNKDTLESEKSRDEFHNQIEQIEHRLHPKRVRTDDDPGDLQC